MLKNHVDRFERRGGEARPADAVPEALGEALQIETRLRRAGLRVALLRRGGRLYAGGCAVALGPGRSDFADSLACLGQAASLGLPVGVHLQPADEEAADADLFQALEELFALAEPPAPRAATLTLSIDHDFLARVPSTAFLALPGGRIRRYCFVDRGELAPLLSTHGGHARQWLPAMHAGVRSRCPLLSAESSGALLPVHELAVPSGSAWLPITLDLMHFVDGRGRLQHERLDAALCTAVDCGDELHDLLAWCGDKQAEDARRNRRLAINLTGIGAVIAARSLDPASLECLREFDRLVDGIHTRLWQRSGELAGLKGALPALAEHAPSARWRDETHRQDWARRWQQAVAKVQVRNRNLLAMSPWSLLSPADASLRCADLMPLVAHADVVGFAAPQTSARTQHVDLKSFHERMRAQVQRFNATTLIAGGA